MREIGLECSSHEFSVLYCICTWDVIIKYHHLCGLNKKKLLPHNSGGWEVKNQEADRFGFPGGVFQVSSHCILS